MNARQYVVVTRTIQVVFRADLAENYSDMTSIQAIDYELQLPREDKVRQFIKQLELTKANEVELTETVRVETEA